MTPLARGAVAWLVGLSMAAWLAPFPGPPRPTTTLMLTVAGLVAAVGALAEAAGGRARSRPTFALGTKVVVATALRPHPRAGVRRKARAAAALGACALFGGARHMSAMPELGRDHVASLIGPQQVQLRGRIVADPAQKDGGIDIVVAIDGVADYSSGGDDFRPVQGQVLARVPRHPLPRYGQLLLLDTTLEEPPLLDDFDYRAFLARQDIYALARRPRVTVIESDGGALVMRALLAIRHKARRTLRAALPDPEAALAVGILLGDDDGIPPPLYDRFRMTGTSHVIAISGSNISLLVAALQLGLGRALGRRRGAPVVLGGIVAYTVLVGGDAAVVRAAVMGALLVTADMVGRPSHAWTSLLAAAWAMTLWNPAWLGDLGYQLSFAATAGLLALAGPLGEATRRRLGGPLGGERASAVARFMDEALWMTLAAQLATWPLIAWHTGAVTVSGLLANSLIVPVQPAVMGLGAMCAAAGAVNDGAGLIFGAVAWLPLAWTIRVVDAAAGWPLAEVPLQPPLVALVAWYTVLGLAIAPPEARARWAAAVLAALLALRIPVRLMRGAAVHALVSSAAAPVLAGLALLAWVGAITKPDGLLHVTLLDVGQGDAILTVTPNGRRMLIDGGPAPSLVLSGLGRRFAPWDRRLDLVVLSHPDADHVAGLPAVLARYDVRHIMEPLVFHGTPDAAAWALAVAGEGATHVRASAGGRIVLDEAAGVYADILWPPAGEPPLDGSVNNRSVVMRLVYGEIAILLTGDIEDDVEESLLRMGAPLAAHAMKAAHHGSDSSSNSAFLEAVSPAVVLISAGVENRFGHPAPAVLERLRTMSGGPPVIARTDQDGAVELISDGQDLWLRRGAP